MMDLIKKYIQQFLRIILRVMFVFPIKKHRILFSAFDGRSYSDSPKCISQYLAGQRKKIEIVWALNSVKDINNDNFTMIRYHSLKWIYYIITSAVIITNSNTFAFIPKRKGQFLINTWHGGGAYKKVGYLNNSTDSFGKWTTDTMNNDVNLFISSSKIFTDLTIRESFHYKGMVCECGLPRNDCLLNQEVFMKLREKVRRNLNLQGITFLYAPTFRGGIDEKKAHCILPVDIVLKEIHARYGKEAVLLIRSHYYNDSFNGQMGGVIDVSKYPDMQELICASDVLVTDYSSCMWDYALTTRPILLYTPDLSTYIEGRGLYTDPNTWPGRVCVNETELLKEIAHIDYDYYKNKCFEYLELCNSYENGNATQIVGELVINHLKC